MKSWRRYLRFWGPDIEADVRDELRFHFERRVEEFVASGLSRDDAERAARERLGDLEKVERELERHDRSRAQQARWAESIYRLIGDVRVAARSLRRSITFTVAAVSVLGLAIGSASAMLTIYRAVLIDRLPVAGEDRLLVLNPLSRNGTHIDVPYSYLAEIARDSMVFRAVAGTYHLGAQPRPFTFGDRPVELGTTYASANLFDALGARPALGRFFLERDGAKGAFPVVVLSYSAWRKHFGADSTVVGRKIVMPYSRNEGTIAGVAPPGLEYPEGTEAWLTLTPQNEALQVDIVARIAPNATAYTARAELLALEKRHNPFADTSPKLPLDQYEVVGVDAHPFAEKLLGKSRPAIVALTVAVGVLLLIACINVGSLVLVRLLGRSQEIAIRRAIGASYGDILRLFTIENIVIALIGGALGVLTATMLVRLTAAFAPAQLARRDSLALVGSPLVATTLIALGALALFGLAPSVMAAKTDSVAALRSGARAGMARSGRRARRWLVATQMALAVVLLAGAALLARSLATLTSMDLGYRPEYLSVLQFSSPKFSVAVGNQLFDMAHEIVAHLEATPGVVAASSVESLPFRGRSLFIMRLAPQDQRAKVEDAPWVPWEFVGPSYFRTFDIPIVRGRAFQRGDTKGSQKVVVVNESLAKQFWPGQDPIGKQVLQTVNGSAWTVVGVARNAHFRELTDDGPLAYFEWDQVSPFWNGIVAIRTTRPLKVMMPTLAAATRDADPTLSIWRAETMDQLLDAPMARPRLSAALFGGFSLAALLLSAIGLYGVLASSVRQQTRDIGVRIALGALPADVRRLVLGDALAVVAGGGAVGVAGALVGGRLLSAQLYGVSPSDPVAVGVAALSLVVIGLIAAYAPARRATRIDPVEALRSE